MAGAQGGGGELGGRGYVAVVGLKQIAVQPLVAPDEGGYERTDVRNLRESAGGQVTQESGRQEGRGQDLALLSLDLPVSAAESEQFELVRFRCAQVQPLVPANVAKLGPAPLRGFHRGGPS